MTNIEETKRQAYDLGNKNAMYVLAMSSRFAINMPQNLELSAVLLRMLNREYDGSKKVKASIKGNLGMFYFFGIGGIIQNYVTAVEFFKQAAELGNVEILPILAWLYKKGIGVDQNLKEALSLYEKASEMGNSQSKKILAEYYVNGDGVAKDIKKAEQLKKDADEIKTKETIEYYQCQTNAGDTDNMFKLAECYETGVMTPKNIPEAIKLFKAASELGRLKAKERYNVLINNSS